MDDDNGNNVLDNPGTYGGQESTINIELDSVYGPFKVVNQIPEILFPFMADKAFEIFIPIKIIIESYEAIKLHQLVGNNVYQCTSSLIAAIFHQGIIIANQLENGQIEFSGNRLIIVFDADWNVTQTERYPLQQKPDEMFVGVTLIFKVTQEMQKFDSAKNYDIKSKSGKGSHGIAIIYAEPALVEPQCLDQTSMDCVAFYAKPQYDEMELNWLKFGFSGEVMSNYDIRNFEDYDLPYENWLTQRFKKASLYFDTIDSRYELTATQGGKVFKLSQLLDNAPSLGQIRSEGSPLKEDKKMLIVDGLDWPTIIWGEKTITINDVQYGPIHSYFWAKRKRIIA
ncbi:hypothetical protein TVAG_054510 [Trichomonas vaginalis G3]|uniref:Uncharacterized protein n=1 Tax=Trichomonas vaginalis (strain ATCC PRA-98 / G3) TaxID=412133 RepID=A2EYC6_TRIV3|nr:hypothetical protein TVAGG3_0774230 [Trichomonas vaginalis G3]EAY02353.1 hypothetical protein TVAG_054510 [Trichomonas vaginalis G3]KAI5514043.1 hypothetical protein TVAGG3_0774230 [Trichomonas vaginalis G3]|eukprot:XP_001330620.1 hypothetical protein [Trichomonas vaginalis G3]